MQALMRLIPVLATSFLLLLQGCNFRSEGTEPLTDESQPTQTNTSNQPNETDPFRDAVNKAMEAANLAQTARTAEEWTRVAESWQQAINFMRAVPESSTNYEVAQQKAVEYQGNLEYAQSNSAAATDGVQQVEQTPEQDVPISQQAALLKMGITYREVVALLGRTPDTVVNDQIRQELGEPVQGNSLITFEWKNDNPDCQPVSAQFNPSGMTLTGWSEGRTCTGSSIFNEPFGKSCAETTLCELR